MYKDIARLVAQCIDKDSLLLMEQYGRKSQVGLNLVGDSIFTTAIESKLKKLGIRQHTSGDFWDLPFVVDTEMENPPKAPFTDKAVANDIDHVYWGARDSMSADATAALALITEISEFKDCIVAVGGRGHGVKGLTRALIANDYTVTQCHSHTKDVKYAIHTADILVWSEPEWPFLAGAFPVRTRLIIDISYRVPKAFPQDKVVRVGNIATSTIINRAIRSHFGARA